MKNRLDIVLPCYNPVESWAYRVVEGYLEISEKLSEVEIQVILVNDGSSKGISPQDIEYLEKHIPHFTYLDQEKNYGKGEALRVGVAFSNAAHCIFTDVDFPYQTTSLLQILEILRKGQADIAIGIKDEQYYAHLPWFRIQVSKFLRFLARTFLRISITDTQCGLKGFNQKGKEVFLKTSIQRYLADLEFIFLADRRSDLSMKSVPVSLKPGIEFSKVNLKILFAEGINFLRVFVRSFGR